MQGRFIKYMAYSDYGAFVYKNGERQEDLEDCECRYNSLGIAHGMITDGVIDVVCYKQGLPTIYKDGKRVDYYDFAKINPYEFESFDFELDGYKFHFDEYKIHLNEPYTVTVKTPSGDEWVCEYDYGYGAGF